MQSKSPFLDSHESYYINWVLNIHYHLCFGMQSGVDVNSWHRVLLRSAKPALHANVNCTPLIAAIVARQDLVVKYFLKVFLQLLNQRKELGICIPILKLSSCNGILRLISSEMGLRIQMGFCRRFDLCYYVFFFCNWQAGAKTKCKVSLGAWTWDYGVGEEL